MEIVLTLERYVTEGNRITLEPLLDEETALSEVVIGGQARHGEYSL